MRNVQSKMNIIQIKLR